MRPPLPAPLARIALAACTLTGLVTACSFPPPDEQEVCQHILCSAGRCMLEDGEPQCVCGAAEQAAGLSCVLVADLRQDDHGDTRATATLLPGSVPPTEGRFDIKRDSQPDRDVFAFEAQAGHTYHFQCTPAAGGACDVRLTDATGTFWLSAYRNGLAALVAPQTGRLYAFVEGYDGSYSYSLLDQGPDEAGATLETARPLPSGATLAGILGTADDVDLYSLSLAAGHSYRLTLELGTLADARVSVYQPPDGPLGGGVWVRNTEPFVTTLPAGEERLLLLSIKVNTSPVGSYTVRLDALD